MAQKYEDKMDRQSNLLYHYFWMVIKFIMLSGFVLFTIGHMLRLVENAFK